MAAPPHLSAGGSSRGLHDKEQLGRAIGQGGAGAVSVQHLVPARANHRSTLLARPGQPGLRTWAHLVVAVQVTQVNRVVGGVQPKVRHLDGLLSQPLVVAGTAVGRSPLHACTQGPTAGRPSYTAASVQGTAAGQAAAVCGAGRARMPLATPAVISHPHRSGPVRGCDSSRATCGQSGPARGRCGLALASCCLQSSPQVKG